MKVEGEQKCEQVVWSDGQDHYGWGEPPQNKKLVGSRQFLLLEKVPESKIIDRGIKCVKIGQKFKLSADQQEDAEGVQ